MLFSEQNQSSSSQSLNTVPSTNSPSDDTMPAKQTIAEPEINSSNYSFFKTNSAADILTLNNLAYIDPMHKQLHASGNVDNASEPADSKVAYSLFNKNFTTFVKYSESNIDINMALSSSLKNDSHSMDTAQNASEVELSHSMANSNKELRINDMLAATSLSKDQDNQMESSKPSNIITLESFKVIFN